MNSKIIMVTGGTRFIGAVVVSEINSRPLIA